MLDANIVIAKCIEVIYEAAEPYRAGRIGTWAGRVIPKSDGGQTVRIRVNIVYNNGEERYAPIDCTIDRANKISIKEHHE